MRMEKIDYQVPFFANTEDDTHCVQAAFRMVLGYFLPDSDFTWEQLDEATGKQKDMWTWPMVGLNWIQTMGFEVTYIEEFDYQKFIDDGKDYLVEKYGREVADAQARHSNIVMEQENAKDFIQNVSIDNRIPEVADISKLLSTGYLVIASVNSRTLNGNSGYVGHAIVVKGIDDDGVLLHDPGLPALKNRKVPFDLFDRAWSYPDQASRDISAFRLTQ
jgi:hypothetical protein